MSTPDHFTDPRHLGGEILSPAGQHDPGDVLIDTTRAVLLKTTTVALGHNRSDGMTFATLLLTGRINRTQHEARALYMMNADGAASVVAELLGLAQREGGAWAAAFHERLAARIAGDDD